MSDWTADELTAIASAEELRVAPAESDRPPSRYTKIWVVRVGDDLYVRSFWGRGAGWYRRALLRHEGRIRVSGTERDVTFIEAGDGPHAAIDQAYRSKYAGCLDDDIDAMITPNARAATLRLVPRSGDQHHGVT